MHFQHTGDYIVAVNNPTTQSIKGWSTPITITDGAATKPTNVALTGDNLTAKTAVGAVVGTLSATDANPVTYSLTYNQHNLFSIVGNQLELAQAVPANPMSAYYVTVNATDSTGGSTSKQFKVGVQPAPAAATAQISAASVSSATSTTAAFLPASHSSIVASAGGGDVTFGTDNESFSAAGGAWNYSFGSGAGLETIGNFDATTGDTINIAASLQGALHESVAGGSTTLSFGDATHGIVLQGVSNFATSQIHWG
jgi:hypothetical protein